MPPASMSVARVSIFCSRSGMLAGPSFKPSAWKLIFATAEAQMTASCFSVKIFRARAPGESAARPADGQAIQTTVPVRRKMEGSFIIELNSLPFWFQFDELRANAALDEKH